MMMRGWLYIIPYVCARLAQPTERSGGEAVHISPLIFSPCRSDLPSLLGSPYEHCKVAEDFEVSHGVSFAAN